jgi:hypothetical protein
VASARPAEGNSRGGARDHGLPKEGEVTRAGEVVDLLAKAILYLNPAEAE